MFLAAGVWSGVYLTEPGDGRKGVGLVSNTTRGSILIAVPLRILCPRLCLPGSVPCQERHAEETWAAALPIHQHSASEAGVPSERSTPLSLPPAPELWLTDFAWGKQ